MKKITYTLLALSIAGAFLSGLLLLQHYYPNARIGFISCSQGIFNPCLSLAQSGYATLFTIPVAAYGLLWYLMALFILLIADYAGGRYQAYSLAVLLPLGAAAVAADVVLGIILIITGLLCPFCISTYVVNLAMLALVILWYRKAVKEEQFSLAGVLAEIFLNREPSPDRKAFNSAFVLFAFLLVFAVFATSQIMKVKTDTGQKPEERIAGFMDKFNALPVEKITFPDGGIVLGNPKAEVTIYAFTDFLCSACYEFYKIETMIFKKYGSRVRTVYYNYPLDMSCNGEVKRTVYKNSCVASRAFLAAWDSGILDEYITKHFEDYQKIHSNFSVGAALATLGRVPVGARGGLDSGRFTELMNSESVTRRLNDQVKFARDIKVDATPTLFIGGRRLVGVPQPDLFDQIISAELAKTR
jgi:predicted DsbA family dithiol-disulfide isomerase/uncharacterized membrane protein